MKGIGLDSSTALGQRTRVSNRERQIKELWYLYPDSRDLAQAHRRDGLSIFIPPSPDSGG